MQRPVAGPVAVIDAVLACQATGTMPTPEEWKALRELRNELANQQRRRQHESWFVDEVVLREARSI